MGQLQKLWKHIWRVDKLYHLVVGTAIFLACIYILKITPGNSLVVVFTAGAYKEISDEFIKKTGGDPWDFFATIFLPILIYIFFF